MGGPETGHERDRIAASAAGLRMALAWSPGGQVTGERHVVDGRRWTFAVPAGAPPIRDVAATARALTREGGTP